MGLFDFFKPKKSELNDSLDKMKIKFFPKGEKDINAVTDALLLILNSKIDREEAQNIAVKSVVISRVAKDFNSNRLKQHLAGYCLQHFNDEQIESFTGYLEFLMVADTVFKKSPSEVVRSGDGWGF